MEEKETESNENRIKKLQKKSKQTQTMLVRSGI